MSGRRLPPYAKTYLGAPPSSGLSVAIGPGAWKFAKARPFPVLVLPPGEDPTMYRWPSHPGGALIHERGTFDDVLLIAMATELLKAGSPFAVAIREALVDEDPRHFFYPGAAA